MDKYKENEILLVRQKVLKFDAEEVDILKKEVELYNDIYKEISEIVGLEATLKIYLRFKGQQVSFPVRLYRQERSRYMLDCFKQCGFQNLDFVIRQEDGSPFLPDSMSKKWRRFLEEHNLPSIRFHDLRHSNATALIQAGVNPRVVQQRLGHSDVNITLNTYTHVLPEMDIDAAQKLDHIMLQKKKQA